MKGTSLLTFLFLSFALISGCAENLSVESGSEGFRTDRSVNITTPGNGSILPLNCYYPFIEWDGLKSGDNSVKLVVSSSQISEIFEVSGNSWKPEGEAFRKFLKPGEISFYLEFMRKDVKFRSPEIRVKVSENRLNDGIVYRIVDPLFKPEGNSLIESYLLDGEFPEKIYSAENKCIGCHFYSTSMDVFNVKKSGDRRLIVRDKRSGLKFNQKSIGHFSFLSIFEEKNIMAVTVNAVGKIDITKDVRHPFDLVYQSGDIFIYDLKNDRLLPLPGASELDFVEDMPVFSPDGSFIYFVRYNANMDHPDSMYICRIPYNDGNGGRAEIIRKLSGEGMYFYFPQVSPDGKWLSFCTGNGSAGIFARNDSDICIMNISTGDIRKMNLSSPDTMESWHSWSSDSKWMVFSAKTGNNVMTSLYLVNIDDNGNDSAPVKLNGYSDRKINIPLFVKSGIKFTESGELSGYLDEIYE